MGDKTSDVINNICTILGGALLLYPLIDEATKTIIPEMQKLASGETTEGMRLLPSGREEKPAKDEREQKPRDEEIEELKRKLAEYESESDAHEAQN